MIFEKKTGYSKSLSTIVGVLALFLGCLFMTFSCTTQASRKVRKGCLDCHPELVEKFATGHVHQPVSEGLCKKCHRPHGLVGGIYLRTPQPGLCLGCHTQLAKDLSGLSPEHRHQPVNQGKCTTCHQPHNAENKFLLDKPAVESCFACHEQAVFTKPYQHQPLVEEGGCRTCHDPHGTTFPKLLAEPVNDLCRRCHDYNDQNFKARHSGYPVVTACLTCHDVHSADNALLLRPVLHQPVSELDCKECHLDAAQSQPFALQSVGSALCQECHDVENLVRSDPAAHQPVVEGECLTCHSPHASDYRGMTLLDTGPLCLSCHQFEQVETGKKGLQKKGNATLHQPLLEGDCLACHQAHQAQAGEQKLLRRSFDQLCQDCHETASTAHLVNHPPAAACHTCHQPHESREPALLLESQRRLCSGCHDSIMDQLSQKSLHRPFVSGDCSACHTPHGGERKYLLQVSQKDLCQSCHQQLEARRQEAFSHQPFKEGNCRLCHRVHSSDEPFLLNGSGETLCLGCHQEQRPLPEHKVVHQPVAGFNCTACHDGHGQDRPAYLLQDKPALCLRCHNIDRDWQEGRAHGPAADGSCDSCHAAHFAERRGLLLKDTVMLCWDCHSDDEATFKKSHNGVGWGRQECLSCHDPHGAPPPGDGLLLPYAHKPFIEKECQDCHGGDS